MDSVGSRGRRIGKSRRTVETLYEHNRNFVFVWGRNWGAGGGELWDK